MIQIQTKLNIIDNTEGKKAQCIKVYSGKTANIGDTILNSIKKNQPQLKSKIKIKKGEIFKGIVIQTKYKKKKKLFNEYLNFDINSVILVSSQKKPLGTRILGPVSNQLRKVKQIKLLSLASAII